MKNLILMIVALVSSNIVYSEDVNVVLSNINKDLYPCKIGFRPNNCETCNPTVDKLEIHLENGSNVLISYPDSMVFSPKPRALTAGVALNSLVYSSGWYVEYCLDVNNSPTEDSTTPISAAAITGTINIYGAEDNGYLNESKLNYLVSHACGGVGEQIVPDNNDNLWDQVKNNETAIFTTGPEPLILSPNPLVRSRCVWTLSFQERSCEMRKVNNVSCSAGTCLPYSSAVYTGIEAFVDY